MNNFAVIDTETTWDNQVMSIGVVIADGITKELIDAKYFLLDPEYKMPGMYSSVLHLPGIKESIIDSRESVMNQIANWLTLHGVDKILAYNAAFDKGHLPELKEFIWCDIMRLAAYRQYNKRIPADADCYGTGKLKRGYGVEPILRMLGNDKEYTETHNAYYDAMDELKIVQLLGHSLDSYDIAILDSNCRMCKNS